MNYLLPILVFIVLMGAYYVLISRKTTPGEGVSVVLAIVAAFPLLSGGLMLFREYGRWQQGRVAAGVVTGKLSSTGENGSRTIGGRYPRPRGGRRLPTVVTSNGFRFDDVLARLMLSGSPDAWFIEYRYPCDTSGAGCWERESVSHDLWSELQVGNMVNVRTAKDQDDRGRLDANALWGTAIAKVAIGGTLALLAGFVSGRLALRRPRFVTVSAVVTSVEPMTAGGKVQHWRVKYAYLTPDGTAFENADEVYAPGIRPGDNCLAVYPPDQPDCGTLRLIDRVAG